MAASVGAMTATLPALAAAGPLSLPLPSLPLSLPSLSPSGDQAQVLQLATALQQAEASLSRQDLQLQDLMQQAESAQTDPAGGTQSAELLQQFNELQQGLDGEQTQDQAFTTQLPSLLDLLSSDPLLGQTLSQQLQQDLSTLTGNTQNDTPSQVLEQAVSTFTGNLDQATALLSQLNDLLASLPDGTDSIGTSAPGVQSPEGSTAPGLSTGAPDLLRGGASPSTTTRDKSTPACTPPGHSASDANVSDPSAPHGLYVLSGSQPLSQAQNGKQIQTYLVNNPDVCGGAVFVFWNKLDNGPGAKQRYNWSYVDQLIAPWAKAHKTVALLLGGATGYASKGQPGGVPSWLVKQLSVVNCGQLDAPVYWQNAYASNWMNFVAAFINHFQSNPNVAYINVGVGSGEQTLVLGVKSDPSCLAKWNAAGYQTEWPSYVSRVISFVGALHTPVQLNVSINAFANFPSSGQIAAQDSSWGIGFGFNGLEASDVTEANDDQQCAADWCQVYDQYAGRVPLYVQTRQASDPGPGADSDSQSTGPLPPLLTTALAMHTQIFELYAQDWLMAFDPSFPGYLEYHTKTAQALASAASIVGTSRGAAPKGSSL